MNAYQRGNRDGLLNLAAEFAGKAAGEEAAIERLLKSPGYRSETPGHVGLLANMDGRMRSYLAAADLARRRAEAVPDDPEG